MFTLGFTGTRRILAQLQMQAIWAAVHACYPERVVHGDCIGADRYFHEAVMQWKSETPVVVLPGHDRFGISPHRAHCKSVFGEIAYSLPYLERNRRIVALSDLLLAAPGSLNHQHSGTWYTINEARARGLDRIIILPDGTIEINYSAEMAETITDASVDTMCQFLEELRVAKRHA